nr:hypothetical protein [Fusobacterium necrophorum]
MKIAILGATGAVGQQMMKCLIEQEIPVTTLKLLASAKSIGKKYSFQGKEICVEEANESSFEGMDIVLGAVESDMAKKFAPFIKKREQFLSITAVPFAWRKKFLWSFRKSMEKMPDIIKES